MTIQPEMILALGKVLIAAAWADHELALEEVNSLKDLLFTLRGLSAAQWAELDIYLHAPVGPQERQRLLAELQRQIRTEADRQLALKSLQEMVEADGSIPEEEAAVLEQIRQAIEESDTGLFGMVGGLLKGALSRRSEAASSFPDREAQLDDFIHNRVFYSVRRRLDLGEAPIKDSIDEDALRTLCLAGGLMARIARLDQHVTDGELEAMVRAMRESWGLDEEAAAFVVDVAVTEAGAELDNFRLARTFFEQTSNDQRIQFVEALFQVAAADGQASHDEIETIRRIARTLKLSHRQFINAKLTLPKDQRAS
ncbi:MAG: TerB family tellurite resistance protein [Anaerolineales bacterium]